MNARLRRGKYHKYEKRILQFLAKQEDEVSSSQIRVKTKIPKSSCYDVLGKLRYEGYIGWIGEPQDWISMIEITDKGRGHLQDIQNMNS